MENEFIEGAFVSNRGVYWCYRINTEYGWAEQWHENTVRCVGGYKQGRDTYVNPTKELKKIALERHGIVITN